MKNTYVGIFGHMRRQGGKDNPPNIEIGTMIDTNTLKVGDLQVNKANLKVAENLLNTLKSNDEVATISVNDGQKYIILCKVVDL